jgi:hypothetical protein
MFGFLKKKPNSKTASVEEKAAVFSYDEERVLYSTNFEDGLGSWRPRGPSKKFNPEHVLRNGYEVFIETTSEEKYSGNQCLKVTGRKYGWNGARLDITKYLRDNIRFYEVAVWVKIPSDAPSCRVCVSLEANTVFAGVPFQKFHYWHDFDPEQSILSKFRAPVGTGDPKEWDTQYPHGYTTGDGWILLRGMAEIYKTHFDSICAYIETDDANSSIPLYVDNFMLLSAKSQVRTPDMPVYTWSN